MAVLIVCRYLATATSDLNPGRAHRPHNPPNLLQMRPLVHRDPRCINQHRPLQQASRARNNRLPRPVPARKRFQNRQQISPLPGECLERRPKLQLGIIRALHPRPRIHSLDRRRVLGENRCNSVAPNISARPQMSQDFVDRPLTRTRRSLQLIGPQTGRQLANPRHRLSKQRQDLLNSE
jgi:hypothetical protein